MEKVVLTYEDYAALPDDDLRYELHEGELSVTPAPGARHQLVIGNLRAEHGVPWYWIADPVGRMIESHHLEDGVYRLVAMLDGDQPRALPPFDDLPLDPAGVWR